METSQDAQDTVNTNDTENNGGQETAAEELVSEQTAAADDSAQQESADVDTQSADEDSEPSQIEALAAQLAVVTEQLGAAKDAELRTQAEMQNLRRRSERDVENAHKYGLEKLINGLLPVLDNFDRAINAVGEDAAADNEALKALLEGVELTRKSAIDVLSGFSVEVLEPFGEPFDPQFHEAMTMVPSATAEPNSVIDVLQKGYTLNGRLLRAAMVVVAKAAE